MGITVEGSLTMKAKLTKRQKTLPARSTAPGCTRSPTRWPRQGMRDRQVRRVDRRLRCNRHRRQEVRPGPRRGRDAPAPARPSASPCSPRAPRPKRRVPPGRRRRHGRPGRAGQGRQPELRRRDRLAGHDARRGHAGPDPGPRGLMPNPEGRHGDARRRARPCATPRPDRCSSASTRRASCTRRSAAARSTGQAGGQPARADRGPEQGQSRRRARASTCARSRCRRRWVWACGWTRRRSTPAGAGPDENVRTPRARTGAASWMVGRRGRKAAAGHQDRWCSPRAA